MLVSSTVAQTPFEVPPVKFENWQVFEENDDFSEYIASFPSAFKSGEPKNDQVQLRFLIPNNGKSFNPTVLILHYWGAPDLKVEKALALDLVQRGLGAAILTLPYHLSRTPKGAVSGALAVQPDPDKLKATMTQAVQDVRRSLDFIQNRKECGEIVGIYGTSLGAIVSSLSYAVDPRLKNAVFLLGGVDLSQILWDSSRIGFIKDELRRKGFTRESLGEKLKDVEPLTYLSEKTDGRTLIIRAKYDTVIPPNCTDQLIQRLPNSKVLEIDTGHYGGIFIQGRLLREAANFFQSVAEKRAYNPPTTIVAPTIRVGLLGLSSGRFDVVAGFDVLKFDKRGKQYASLLITPRTPVLWIGAELNPGLNVGAGLSGNGSGLGIFWSTVL